MHDDRRQAFGGLVKEQELSPGAQDAGNRQHLLFAARQLGALAGRTLLQVGKQLVDLGDGKAAVLCIRGGNMRFSQTLKLEKMPRSSGQ